MLRGFKLGESGDGASSRSADSVGPVEQPSVGPLEQEIERIMRYRLSSLPAMRNAFEAGRVLPTRDDLISATAEDTVIEAIEISAASIAGLQEAVLKIARELENRSPA
jgi:hypothetical protein